MCSLIVASQYGASFGMLTLFTKALFAELTQPGGRSGAKRIIETHAREAHLVAFTAGEIDVATPDDF